MQQRKIIVSDDQAHIRESLALLFEPENYAVVEATSPQEVIFYLNKNDCDLIIMDMNYSKDTTSGEEGLKLIEQIREKDTVIPIIVMTAWANVALSVNAIKKGANDFIEKPWNNNRLLTLVSNQLLLAQNRSENERLHQLTKQQTQPDSFISHAKSMVKVMQLIERTAASDANILLTGESGVGKSLIAGIIHSLSERKKHPLVSVNMGALADNLFESELFGHVKGAFTDAKTNRMGRFEMAENGTLFLDEIANIPMALQAKLLRVLESSEYEPLGSSKTKTANVRLISASNVDFDQQIEAGQFRQDLLYRLNTITIEIPPLRERKEDIIALADGFLQQLKRKYRRNEMTLSLQAENALLQYQWPGNVRELSHCLERGVLMAEDDEIKAADLGLKSVKQIQGLDDMTLEQAEKYLIKKAMRLNEGNVALAAEKLGISRAALYRRLEKFTDIDVND